MRVLFSPDHAIVLIPVSVSPLMSDIFFNSENGLLYISSDVPVEAKTSDVLSAILFTVE
jgi:hypothetical protein